MRGWVIAGLVLLAYTVQTSLFLSLTVAGVRPDLVLIVVCAIGLMLGPFQGAGVGLLSGFLVDALTGRMIGLGAISKAAAGYVAGWMGDRLFRENALVSVGIAFALSMGEGAVYVLGTHAFGHPIPVGAGLARVVLPEACYNALVAMVLFPLLFKALRFAGDPAHRGRPAES